MTTYESLSTRLSYEERKLVTLTEAAKATRATIKTLKADLAKADPEALKKNKKDSDGLPLVEVRDEGDREILIFSDGDKSKAETVKK